MNRLLATLLGLAGPLKFAPDTGADGDGGNDASGDATPPEASGDDDSDDGSGESEAGGSDSDALDMLFGDDDSLEDYAGELYDSDDDETGFNPMDDDDPLGLLEATDTEEDEDSDSDDADGQDPDGELSSGEGDGADDETEDGDGDGDESDDSDEAGTDGDGAEGEASGVALTTQLGDVVRQRLREVAPGTEVTTIEQLVEDYGQYRGANEEMLQAQNLVADVFQLDPGLATVVETAAQALRDGEDVNVLALLAKNIDGLALEEVDEYSDPEAAARTAAARATIAAEEKLQARIDKQRTDYIDRWKQDAEKDLVAFAGEVGQERATAAAQMLQRFTQG
ncbi:MAG: hypothetical protein AAFQ43_00875, partial [Bacteroidota bacterium]